MKTIGTLFVIIFFASSLNAQEILKSVGNAAKNKVEQQDFNTTRSNKEKSNLQDRKKKSSESPEMPTPAPASTPETPADSIAPAETAPANSKDLTYKQEYAFEGKMTYEIEDLKKADKNTITYRYANGAICTEMPESNSTSIYDYENEVMIMFDEKAMSATVMSSSMMTKMAAKTAENQAEKAGETTITKTGLTKKILGYNCENYISTSADGSKTDFWVTTELVLNNEKAIEAITKNMGPKPSGDYPASGVMMEFTGYNKKAVAETHMIMTAYDATAFSKALTGYRVTTLAF